MDEISLHSPRYSMEEVNLADSPSRSPPPSPRETTTVLRTFFKELFESGKEDAFRQLIVRRTSDSKIAEIVISVIRNLLQPISIVRYDQEFYEALCTRIHFQGRSKALRAFLQTYPAPSTSRYQLDPFQQSHSLKTLRTKSMDIITIPGGLSAIPTEELNPLLDECFRVLKVFGTLVIPKEDNDASIARADYILSKVFRQDTYDSDMKEASCTPSQQWVDLIKNRTFEKIEVDNEEVTVFKRKDTSDGGMSRAEYLANKEEIDDYHKKNYYAPQKTYYAPPVYGFWESVIEYHKEYSATDSPIENLPKIEQCWELFAACTRASFKEFEFCLAISSIHMLLYALVVTIIKTIEYFAVFVLTLCGMRWDVPLLENEYHKTATNNYIVCCHSLLESEMGDKTKIPYTNGHYKYVTQSGPTSIDKDIENLGHNAIIKEVDGMKNALVKIQDERDYPNATPLFTIGRWTYYHMSTEDLCSAYYGENPMKMVAIKP